MNCQKHEGEMVALDLLANDFILASASPRRKELLFDLGYAFTVIPSSFDETNHETMSPETLVQFLAKNKALDVFQNHPNATVLAADTIVVLENTILGKPENEEDAFHMLQQLSGKEHDILTGVCAMQIGKEKVIYVTTKVKFTVMKDDTIYRYIATGEPMDKAGAYGIQGYGGAFIEKIHGNYTNVVGLPIPQVVRLLAEFGIHGAII